MRRARSNHRSLTIKAAVLRRPADLADEVGLTPIAHIHRRLDLSSLSVRVLDCLRGLDELLLLLLLGLALLPLHLPLLPRLDQRRQRIGDVEHRQDRRHLPADERLRKVAGEVGPRVRAGPVEDAVRVVLRFGDGLRSLRRITRQLHLIRIHTSAGKRCAVPRRRRRRGPNRGPRVMLELRVVERHRASTECAATVAATHLRIGAVRQRRRRMPKLAAAVVVPAHAEGASRADTNVHAISSCPLHLRHRGEPATIRRVKPQRECREGSRGV